MSDLFIASIGSIFSLKKPPFASDNNSFDFAISNLSCLFTKIWLSGGGIVAMIAWFLDLFLGLPLPRLQPLLRVVLFL